MTHWNWACHLNSHSYIFSEWKRVTWSRKASGCCHWSNPYGLVTVGEETHSKVYVQHRLHLSGTTHVVHAGSVILWHRQHCACRVIKAKRLSRCISIRADGNTTICPTVADLTMSPLIAEVNKTKRSPVGHGAKHETRADKWAVKRAYFSWHDDRNSEKTSRHSSQCGLNLQRRDQKRLYSKLSPIQRSLF